MSLLDVKNLTISFDNTPVVQDVSFSLEAGERICLIGESGSGKSLTALAITQLLPASAQVSGSIIFKGQELLGLADKKMRKIRGKDIGLVFQEPQTALNPVIPLKHQLIAAKREHEHLARRDRLPAAIELARQVKLPEPEQIVHRYPHELSGGQRQRVVIAMAMSCQPALLIGDEPTTALDATVQATILDLMMESTVQNNTSMLMITHDMAVAARTSDRLLVMRRGQILEQGPTMQVLTTPHMSYTRELVAAARATSLNKAAWQVNQ
ncbi:MAG: ABC transporter ATP-binding protein [Trueperella sp.]|nr:ABC transporter ATP-binding protein [Trueperella sp.]